MKIKLREIAFTFHAPIKGANDWHQFVIHAGKFDGKLDITFAIGGQDGAHEQLPSDLIDIIATGISYAKAYVRTKDLSEQDPEE